MPTKAELLDQITELEAERRASTASFHQRLADLRSELSETSSIVEPPDAAVPTLAEYVAAGYSADTYEARFGLTPAKPATHYLSHGVSLATDQGTLKS